MHTRISSDSCSCSSCYYQEDQNHWKVHLHIFTDTSQQSVQHNFIHCSWAEFLCSWKNSMTLSSYSKTLHALCCFSWLYQPGKQSSKFPDFPAPVSLWILPKWPTPFKNGDFQSIFARSTSAITHSKKSSIITNRKSTTGFPMSARWTAYVASKPHPAARSLCDSWVTC